MSERVTESDDGSLAVAAAVIIRSRKADGSPGGRPTPTCPPPEV